MHVCDCVCVCECVSLTRALCRVSVIRTGYGDPAGRGRGVSLSLPDGDCGRFRGDRRLQRLPRLHPLTALSAGLRPIRDLGHRPPPQDHAAVLLRLASALLTAGRV